jgi:hypothetical protein
MLSKSPSFWSWLLSLFGTLFALLLPLIGSGSELPDDPDGWTPIPPLTPKSVEYYAYLGCTDREIADRFLVDEEHIRREFTPVLRATRGMRALRLRQAQTKLALDGNSPTLIWLGKNCLGQSNSPTAQGVAEPDVQ